MMFAVTIGEVGLQVAALVQAGHLTHFLPAYSHLILATMVIAASWVGWCRSVAPGAREDVEGIFQWEFVVLLLDVSLVITYFILVRTVDFAKERSPRIDSASTVAFLIFAIFALYLVWDLVTKVAIYLTKRKGNWFRLYGARMIPTILCLVIARIVWLTVEDADLPHRISADIALLFLVLLFRALKDFVSACIPREETTPLPSFRKRATLPFIWTVVCVCGITLGTLATKRQWSWPFPDGVLKEISTPLPGEGGFENPCASRIDAGEPHPANTSSLPATPEHN